MTMLTTPLLMALALLWTGVATATGEPDCAKRVFGQYCLGGDASALELTPVEGAEGRFTDAAGNPDTQLDIAAGRITAVERRVEPGGWREYDVWKKRLERLYRSGLNVSTFPRYAASRSSQLNAIRSGRGSARTDWPQTGWLLSLIWREPEAIHLRYELDEPGNQPLSVDDL